MKIPKNVLAKTGLTSIPLNISVKAVKLNPKKKVVKKYHKLDEDAKIGYGTDVRKISNVMPARPDPRRTTGMMKKKKDSQ